MIARAMVLAVLTAAALGAQQGQKAATPAAQQQDSKTQGATKAADTKAPAGRGITVAPESAAAPRVPVILREVFTYSAEGRRDPFVTLLTSEELRPSLADLRLVGVMYNTQRPIAIMRDVVDNTQYRVTTGSKIGRMTVALIKRRSVVFTIEEFGLNRTDSLVFGDTTKARPR